MKKVTLLLIGFFCTLTMFAGEITKEQAMEKARQMMKGKQLTMQTTHHRAAASNDNAYYVFNAEKDGGFVVIAGNDLMPEVLGYAEHGHLDLAEAPDNVKWLFDYYAKVARSLKDTPAKHSASRRASSSRAELIPLMNTQWDQTGIYQAQCPEIDGQKTLTGCVATAMAQVINFFQWPLNNVREAVGYTSEDALKKMELPSLPARQFNWFNMSNDDIAWLMRYCGQAVIMKYGVNESTAFSNAIPGALISVFNFSKGVDEMIREEFTDEEWEDVIYKEIEMGRPVIYNGSSGMTGHSFVLHGYKDGQFYVNWGWGGRMDGYFALTNLKPGDTDFSEKQTAIVGIQPASNNDISYEEKAEIGFKEVHLEKQGQLDDLLPKDIRYSISRLKITGEFGGKDIDVIRDMSNYEGKVGIDLRLQKLDLSEARIVGGEKYINGNYNCFPDELGDWTFQNCATLTSIILPKTLKALGGYVFSNTSLTSIVIPKTVTRIASNALELKTLNTIEVEEGNEVYYSQNNAIYDKSTGVLIRGCKASGIPEGVVEIGNDAFAEAGLESIMLPSSLKKIGERAFAYNTEVKDLYIPASITEIGGMAFFGCSSLKSIAVDEANTVYDSRGNCNAIIETATNRLIQASEGTTIPASVTTIGSNAFSRLNFPSLEIPQTVTKMERSAISEINAFMIKVSYPTPPNLGENPFGWSNSNIRLIVPDGTKELYANDSQWSYFATDNKTIIEETAYTQGRGKAITVDNAGELKTKITPDLRNLLEEVKVTGPLNGRDIEFLKELSQQDGILKSIDLSDASIVDGEGTTANILPENAFVSSYALEHMILPKNLTAIDRYAFKDSGIRELVLPKTVNSLGSDIFYYCRDLEALSVEAGNPVFDSRNNCNAIIETATNMLRIGCVNTIIPETVTAIGTMAFSGKPGLKEVILPNSITSIGWAAFWADDDLTKVKLSAGITELGASPFGGCDRITSLEIDPKNPKYDSRDNCNAIIETATGKLIQGFSTTKIPDGVKTIATAAFRSLSTLTEIEIPASVKTIEPEAFLYCNKMTKVVSRIHKPFAVSSMVFSGDNMRSAQLYVPYGTREAYANTPGWNNFTRIIEMEPVEGEYNKNGLSVGSVDFGKAFAVLGGQVQVPVTLVGEGLEPVTSIDYTITTGSEVTDYHLDLETPINFMMTSEVLITMNADAAIGEHAKIFKLTKVNGVANECTTENIKAEGKLFTMAKMPKVRPVVEEATGTWCGWCSRGIPSLALINKVYKDDVITIAVHGGTGDPMILNNYVLNASAYPSCSVNRNTFVDPYFGSSGMAFGIQREIEAARRDYVPAGIEMEAEWASDVKQTINVKTTTTFVEDVANANYGIGYVLVANGLKGDTPEWYQSNYYSGSSVKDEVLAPLTKNESKMTDVTFNHIPVAAYEPFEGIEGSLPATISKDVALTHNYQIDITGNTRIQDKEKLSVVALLIDKTDGKIVNAAQVKFYQDDESGETAISDAVRQNDPSQMMNSYWYTLDGRRFDVQPTKKGVYIHNGKKQVVK